MEDNNFSYIYAFKNPCYPPDYVKIGKSDNPLRRMREGNTWSPEGLNIEFARNVHDAMGHETRIHRGLEQYHKGGEWFEVDINKVRELFGEIPGEWYNSNQMIIPQVKTNNEIPHKDKYLNLLDKAFTGAPGNRDGYVTPNSCRLITQLIGDDIDEFISLIESESRDNNINKERILEIVVQALGRIDTSNNYAYPCAYLRMVKKYFTSSNL